MDQLQNDTSRPIRLLSAHLLHSRNVVLDRALAWPANRWVSIFPSEVVQNGEPPLDGFDAHWRAAEPFEGYVLEPGASVAIGLVYTIGDLTEPAVWSITRVLYEAGGDLFRYDSPVAEMVMPPPGCVEVEDPHRLVNELLGVTDG